MSRTNDDVASIFSVKFKPVDNSAFGGGPVSYYIGFFEPDFLIPGMDFFQIVIVTLCIVIFIC